MRCPFPPYTLLDRKLESELEKQSMRLTIRMGTIAVAVVGALAAIIKP